MNMAVILTALEVEYLAVRRHLSIVGEDTYRGSVYEIGDFEAGDVAWGIAIGQIGMGNPNAAFEAERAVTYFNATHAMFVGVAGGLKDVDIGDVVAATKIYGYEFGKAATKFLSRPNVYSSSHALVQRAQAVSRSASWILRIADGLGGSVPKSLVAPMAAGSQVVAANSSSTYRLLRRNFSDAIAVEMEGFGFLSALHADNRVQSLVVRGISDLIEGKSEADAQGSQELASRNAAAFALEVLASITVPDVSRIQPVSSFSTVRQAREPSLPHSGTSGTVDVDQHTDQFSSPRDPSVLSFGSIESDSNEQEIGGDETHSVSTYSNGGRMLPDLAFEGELSDTTNLESLIPTFVSLARQALTSGNKNSLSLRELTKYLVDPEAAPAKRLPAADRQLLEAYGQTVIGLSYEETDAIPSPEGFFSLQESADLAELADDSHLQQFANWSLGHFWRKRGDVTKDQVDTRRARRILEQVLTAQNSSSLLKSLAAVEVTKLSSVGDNERIDYLTEAIGQGQGNASETQANTFDPWSDFLSGFQQFVLREARLRLMARERERIDAVLRVSDMPLAGTPSSLPVIENVTFPYTLAQAILRSPDASDDQRGLALEKLWNAQLYSHREGFRRQVWSGTQIMTNRQLPLIVPEAYSGSCPKCWRQTTWVFEPESNAYRCDHCKWIRTVQ